MAKSLFLLAAVVLAAAAASKDDAEEAALPQAADVEATEGDEGSEEYEDFDDEPGVARVPTFDHPLIDLLPRDYNATIERHEAILIEFWAPWCGRCKTIKKEYERAARLAWDLNVSVVFARLDVNAHVAFARDELGLSNVPTFVLYTEHGAASTEFPMLTTAEAFVAGAAKIVGQELDLSPAKVFDADAVEVATWIFWRGTDDGKLQTTVVLYLPPAVALSPVAAADAPALEAAFAGAASELQRFSNLRFAVCRRPDVLAEFELPADRPTLVLYKEHDEGRAEYAGPADAAALARWVLVQDVPLVTDVWHRSLQSFRRRVRTLALFFVSGEQLDHYPTFSRLREELGRVALALEAAGRVTRGDFTIGIADGAKYADWLAAFGLPAGQLPALGIEDVAGGGAMVPAPSFAAEGSAGVPVGGDEGRAYSLAPAADEAERARVAAAEAAAATPSPAAAAAAAAAAGNSSIASAAVDAEGGGSTGFTLPNEAGGGLARVPWVRAPEETLLRVFTDFFDGKLAAPTAEPSVADLVAAAHRRDNEEEEGEAADF